MNDEQIEELLRDRNPWWRKQESWTKDDEVLREAAGAPFDLRSGVLEGISAPSLYLLLGPRRVGKSLAMRRKIHDLIQDTHASPRSIVHCPCDGFSTQDLRRLFKIGRRLARPPEGQPIWWFLDEITAVGNGWSAIVKDARDGTEVRRDCLVLTGSSARGLREAVSNLAGRRGPDSASSERLLLPVGFRRFCSLIDVEGPEVPVLRPADVFTRQGAEALEELSLWTEDLVAAWEAFLRVGGYPRAIADYLTHGDVSDGFLQDLWDVVRADVVPAQMADSTLLSLLACLGESAASPLNASKVAGDTGLQNHHRVNDRIDDLVLNFLAWRCPRMDPAGTPSERSQRKIYFVDPLLSRLPAAIDDHRSAPDRSKLTEQQLGLAIVRSIEAHSPGSFVKGTRVMYLRTPARKEIDFVSPDFEGCFEGKYVDRAWRRESLTAAAHYDKGVLATRRAHDLSGQIWATPAASLAWLLDHT